MIEVINERFACPHGRMVDVCDECAEIPAVKILANAARARFIEDRYLVTDASVMLASAMAHVAKAVRKGAE